MLSLYEISVHSDIDKKIYRDPSVSRLKKIDMLSDKSDSINRIVSHEDLPWKKRKKLLKASIGLKGAAAVLTHRENKYLGSGVKKERKAVKSISKRPNVPRIKKRAA